MGRGMMDVEHVVAEEDPLFDRLKAKHATLRQNHLLGLQRSMDLEHSLASKKMQKLPLSLDLVSEEVILALNEIGTLCEEYDVPKVGQLLKDVRAMMNRQLREAYTYLKDGYKFAFEQMNVLGVKKTPEADEETGKRQSVNSLTHNSAGELDHSGEHDVQVVHHNRPQRHGARSVVSKVLSMEEALSATTGFFAETLAVLLHCQVVRVYLYDEHGNLNCCSRFPFNTTEGDPMAGTHLELMLAKEVHQNVCHKCIAVNGREPQPITLSDRDLEAMEEELQQSGWKSMTSCLIFPIVSSDGFRRPHGMIHAVNKQGISIDQPGTFDENDEVVMSVAARLFGCLLTRYPVNYFMHPVGQRIRQCIGSPSEMAKDEPHLTPLLVDEVEAAAKVGNKALQMSTRLLLYRAPINSIYQTRSLRKNARKLEVLHMVDKSLSTVEFDLAALEELWRVGHEENTQMYQYTQRLNEQVNFLRVLLRNVIDAIGASRTLSNMSEMITYLQVLELYAQQENTSKITDLISQALLDSKFDGPIPPELKDADAKHLSRDDALQIERRIMQTPFKVKFGTQSIPNVRTYWCDPKAKREQVKLFNELAQRRKLDSSGKSLKKQISRFEEDTQTKMSKRLRHDASSLIHFGPADYASKRPFQLKRSLGTPFSPTQDVSPALSGARIHEERYGSEEALPTMEFDTYEAGTEETEVETKLPFVGIVNQGSTCYLNSVIQALFHLPSFRRAIYAMKNTERDLITLALRNIFSLLHHATPFVSTKELTEAFGWSTSDSWIQHDVHEMMQKLFDSLEIICKATPQENFIRDHFYGELTYITRTLDGEAYTAYRREGFYDVELLVKNKKTIYESLDQWAEPERIEGVSLDIREGGPSTIHTVERSQRFARLPPVLLIHPNRVEFCTETFELNTLRSKWSFPTTLDLEPYILPDAKEGEDAKLLCTVYELRSIVIHQGAAQSGHYLTYVRFNEQWVCFNDTIVSRVSEEDVMRAAFGDDATSFSRNLNERASLLVYVNQKSVKDVLEENPVPAHIMSVAEEIVAERERKWKERWESVTYQHISDPNDLINALDGLVDVETVMKTTTVSLKLPTEKVHTAIARDIGQAPERVRVWSYGGCFPSPGVYAQLHDNTRRCNYLFVETLPMGNDANGEMMSEEAFFAPVRLICEGSLIFHGLVHGREELRSVLEECEGMRCLLCEHGPSVRKVSVDEVLAGSNIILCPVSTSNEYVVELLRRRKYKNIEILLLDQTNSASWTPIGSIRLDDDTCYTELQREVYDFLSDTRSPLPPSPEYIGFHCQESGGVGNPSLAVVPVCLPDAPESTLSQLLIHVGERALLYLELLPAPLHSLDTLRLVLFNVGGGIRFTVYVEQRSYSLRELYLLALQQTDSYLPPAFVDYVKQSLARGRPNLRLLYVHSGRIMHVFEDNEELILERKGLFVIDVLTELRAGFSRVNVLFCDRRSGESYFGFPTNIIVSDAYEEMGAHVTQRVAEKLFGVIDEEVEEGLGRWIVAVKGRCGACRTLGRKDSLKKLVEELKSELDCIMVDRPRYLSLDNIMETQRGTEQSIIIRNVSAQDLAAAAAGGSTRQGSLRDLTSMDV